LAAVFITNQLHNNDLRICMERKLSIRIKVDLIFNDPLAG